LIPVLKHYVYWKYLCMGSQSFRATKNNVAGLLNTLFLTAFSQTQHTPRFSGAQHHYFLLDFLQSVAKCYYKDGRAGELLVDLLKLEVPKLFAVEGGEQNNETVGREFSAFLRDYINQNRLKYAILEKMSIILVRKGDKH